MQLLSCKLIYWIFFFSGDYRFSEGREQQKQKSQRKAFWPAVLTGAGNGPRDFNLASVFHNVRKYRKIADEYVLMITNVWLKNLPIFDILDNRKQSEAVITKSLMRISDAISKFPPFTFSSTALLSLSEIKRSHKKENLRPLLCSVFLSGESQMIDLLKKNLKISIEQDACDWLAVCYGGNCTRVEELSEESTNLRVVVFDGPRDKDTGVVCKQRMYPIVANYSTSYRRVWVLDSDISLEGFNIYRFFKHIDCAYNPIYGKPLVSQPLVRQNTQILKSFNHDNWYGPSIPDKLKASYVGTAVYTTFVEQQMPLFDAYFFQWFVKQLVEPLLAFSEALGTDYGYDNLWCKAAREFGTQAYGVTYTMPACSLVLAATPINHLRFNAIPGKHGSNIARVHFKLVGLFLLTFFEEKLPLWYSNHDAGAFYQKRFTEREWNCYKNPAVSTRLYGESLKLYEKLAPTGRYHPKRHNSKNNTNTSRSQTTNTATVSAEEATLAAAERSVESNITESENLLSA